MVAKNERPSSKIQKFVSSSSKSQKSCDDVTIKIQPRLRSRPRMVIYLRIYYMSHERKMGLDQPLFYYKSQVTHYSHIDTKLVVVPHSFQYEKSARKQNLYTSNQRLVYRLCIVNRRCCLKSFLPKLDPTRKDSR